jgi:surfactin synthase thioesterase subunit
MMSPWLLVPDPRASADLRLFCIPHAGRGASLYMPWRALLPESIELNAVQLPGRERRLAEAPPRRISTIAEALATAMLPRLDRAYVMFGHSMGALVCYETCRQLRRLGAPLPRALVLSGRRGPTVSDREPPIHGLPDDAFVAALCARYNGIPQLILDQPDMMRMFLPAMRSDLEAIETYAHRPEPPLPVPFIVYGGRDDPQVAPENVAAWRPLTEARFEQRLFPGGHFYLLDERESLVRTLLQDLAALGTPFAGQRSLSLGRATEDVAGATGWRR